MIIGGAVFVIVYLLSVIRYAFYHDERISGIENLKIAHNAFNRVCKASLSQLDISRWLRIFGLAALNRRINAYLNKVGAPADIICLSACYTQTKINRNAPYKTLLFRHRCGIMIGYKRRDRK